VAKRNLGRSLPKSPRAIIANRDARHLRLLSVTAVSLALHGLVISAVYFAVEKKQTQNTYDQPIEINFEATTKNRTNLRNGDKDLGSSSDSNSNSDKATIAPSSDILTGSFRKQTLERFAQSPATNGQSSTEDQADAAAKGHGWSGAVRFGNSMDIHKTFATLPFYMALHSKIDSSLVYPDDFSRQRITGNVRIEAELDRDGRLLRFVGSVAQDKVLQTYCLAFLLQTLKRPLPQRAWAESSQVVAFEFDFHTHIPGEPQHTFPTVIQKNRLAFGRDNQIEPWLNERINEVFTHYIPPIIPLPGGVYIDFVLAYQFIENLIEGAPTERELRQGRIESLHLHLKDFLRNSTDRSTGTTPES
jgi:hypothetical protein